MRIGKQITDEHIVFVCDDKDIKSTKMFKKKFSLIYNFSKELTPSIKQYEINIKTQYARLMHNLINYNSHFIQEIYSIIPQEEISNKRDKILDLFKSKIRNNENIVSKSMLRMLKNANFIKSEISIFNKLYSKNIQLNKHQHKIHKVLLLVLNSFWMDFNNNGNFLNIEDCAQDLKFDYESVSSALVHLVENTLKYIAPKTELNVSFIHKNHYLILILDMVSTIINDDEIDKIFQEGYSGEIPRIHGLQGKGIGLYMVKRLLKLNGAKIEVDANCNNSEPFIYNEIPYQNNKFKIYFKK
ncbi:MAG: sensor histidine kinase [bacterium]